MQMEESKITLRVDKARLANNQIIIEKLTVYDKITGKVYRVAQMNENLLNLFKMLEIDVSQYQAIEKMMEKNPDLRLLVKTFNLHSF